MVKRSSFEEHYKSIIESCRSIILEMGLPWDRPLGPLEHMGEWQATVQAIDLAIVSYAGTHIRPSTWEVKDQGYFELPVHFASYYPGPNLAEVW